MGLKYAFGAPIYEASVNNCEELNEEIHAISLKLAKNEQLAIKSDKSMWNYKCGIWTSYNLKDHVQSILHDERYPCFIKLRDRIVAHINNYLAAFNTEQKSFAIQMQGSWINIHAPNQFQEWHNHISDRDTVHFSGVYYVTIPKQSGNLILRHCHSNLLVLWRCPLMAIQQHYIIDPSPGKVVIFPSWMDHMVEKNASEHSRISIAFNFGIFMQNDLKK